MRIATDVVEGSRRRPVRDGLRVLLLPVRHRLDAVAVRARRGRPGEPPPERDAAIRQGVTGGETRFQILARVTDIRRHVGVTLKADVPDDTLTIESWFTVFAGANWHERETHEMFGITFAGHPDLRNMYLPTEFEGFPLRKDFPLLARMVKPWPGIVDVEPMPAEEAPADDAVAGEVAPESPTPDQADAGLGTAPAEDAADEAAVGHSVEEAPDHEAPPPGDDARTDSGAQQDLVADIPVDEDSTERSSAAVPSRRGSRDRRGAAADRRVRHDADGRGPGARGRCRCRRHVRNGARCRGSDGHRRARHARRSGARHDERAGAERGTPTEPPASDPTPRGPTGAGCPAADPTPEDPTP